MNPTVEYDWDHGLWKVDGKKVRRMNTDGGHTRAMFFLGSNHVLKVDYDLAQSISEWTNYHETPKRWQKYLAPAVACGVLPDCAQEHKDDPRKVQGWVVQKRIPILRASDWCENTRRASSPRVVQNLDRSAWKRAVAVRFGTMTEFAEALTEQVSGWCDARECQYSIVKGKPVIHDYANCRLRDEQEYAYWRDKWTVFTEKWDFIDDYLAQPVGVADLALYKVTVGG